jgi:hypothetical protein
MTNSRTHHVWLGGALLLLAAAGCQSSSQTPPPPACKVDTDCPVGAGVCRAGTCNQVSCTVASMCGPGEICSGGACVAGMPPMTCNASSDCPPASGVCRDGVCVSIPCGEAMTCKVGEQCVAGMCKPGGDKGVPGHTLAAGGSVSTSDKHIHIGLTGQGRAVGPGASATHHHIGGATAVMGR